jgi:hypothetical protein
MDLILKWDSVGNVNDLVDSGGWAWCWVMDGRIEDGLMDPNLGNSSTFESLREERSDKKNQGIRSRIYSTCSPRYQCSCHNRTSASTQDTSINPPRSQKEKSSRKKITCISKCQTNCSLQPNASKISFA